MSEALIGDPGSSRCAPPPNVERLPAAKASGSPLPIVQPGQVWLVELPPSAPELSPLEYRALTTANVVIYDRALAPTVARFLPLGGYAEPAAPSNLAHDAAWKRCVRFARDGWSVVRLVEPVVSSRRQLSKRVLTPETPADLPVLLFANAGGAYEKSEAQLDELDAIIGGQGRGQSPTLTIVFGALDAGAAPRLSVASANGLAG